MSGFSLWNARIRRPTTFTVADAPVDAIMARDQAVNNVNHYADSFGQVRARFVGQGGTYIESTNTNNKTWRQMWSTAFPIALRPDGSSYRLRVRLAGAAENAGFEVFFAVAVTAPGVAASSAYPADATTDATWVTGSITATAAAYLAGTSQGTEAWTTMIAMSADETAACVRSTATVINTADVPISVTQALAQVTVWGYDDDVTHHGRLHALDIEEWPG